MSHTVDVKTQIIDESCLITALMRVENPTGQAFSKEVIEIYKDSVPIQTYQNHNNTRANVVIRQRNLGDGSYNDLGFVRNSDGTYTAIVADMYDKTWLQRLTTYYGVEKAKKEFKVKGIKYTETVDEKGRIQLKAAVYNGGLYA